MTTGGCGAPAGGAKARNDGGKEAVVQGRVTSGGAAVPSGYARLLNDGGEFVAECRWARTAGSASSPRPAPGAAGARARRIQAERTVSAATGEVTELEVAV